MGESLEVKQYWLEPAEIKRVMAEDPGFIFYPGDYLRDTQNLSEKTQVSYDRIMCEHMRNICITQAQLKFFTKRLSPDEIDELKMVLVKKPQGYCIKWVAESIDKRRNYSESRRKNRKGKTENPIKTEPNISATYDSHMENEIGDANEIDNVIEIIYPFDSENFKSAWKLWTDFKKQQFKFTYKPIGLQGALKELGDLADGDELMAISIIEQSIKKGWKGFFGINKNNNGKKFNTDEEIIAASRKFNPGIH